MDIRLVLGTFKPSEECYPKGSPGSGGIGISPSSGPPILSSLGKAQGSEGDTLTIIMVALQGEISLALLDELPS